MHVSMFVIVFACFSTQSDTQQLHEKAVIKSSVLKLVREMDDDNQQQHPRGGATALGAASSKTGRTQNTTPWMKTSGVRSAYNVYKQVDEEQGPPPPPPSATHQQQTARQEAVSGSARPTGTPGNLGQKLASDVKPATVGSRAPATIGIHSPMGYKPITPKTSPASQPSSSVGPSQYQSLSVPGVVPGQQSEMISQAPPPAIDTPVSGFRSVSPALGSSAKAGPASSVLDKNFNIKPRPFGFSPSQPSHVEPPVPVQQRVSPVPPPMGATQQSVSPIPPPVGATQQHVSPIPHSTGQTDTGPGYGGPKMFAPPIWSERTGASLGPSDDSNAPYMGTEAHGTDATDSAYNPDPSNPSGTSLNLFRPIVSINLLRFFLFGWIYR